MKIIPRFCRNMVGIGLAVREISGTNAFLGESIGHRQPLQQGIIRTRTSFLYQDGPLVGGGRSNNVCMDAIESENSSRGGAASVGPKAEGRRRSSRSSDRRTGPRQPRSPSSSGPTAVGPKSTGPRSTGPRSPRPDRSARRRRTEAARSNSEGGGPPPNPAEQEQPMRQQKSPREPFDGKILTARQDANPDALRLDLRSALSSPSQFSGFRCVTQEVECFEKGEEQDVQRPEKPFEYRSLDDLVAFIFQKKGIKLPSGFFSLSEKFNSDEAFRKDLRSAIRLDVFETTPFYANLPEKAKSVLLLPDSSLEGSWRIPKNTKIDKTEKEDEEKEEESNGLVRRMKHTTRILNVVLEEHFHSIEEENDYQTFLFTGDDLFEAIGAICNEKCDGHGASTHWIDIYGVQDRKINHSWHLDAGRSPQNCRTVLWGFPPEDHYTGTGIFSHIVSLEDPFGSTLDIVENESNGTEKRSRMEPILFEGTPGEDYVFRPLYEPGRELLIYRDIDVLHSAPDVAYRNSVMRFM